MHQANGAKWRSLEAGERGGFPIEALLMLGSLRSASLEGMHTSEVLLSLQELGGFLYKAWALLDLKSGP